MNAITLPKGSPAAAAHPVVKRLLNQLQEASYKPICVSFDDEAENCASVDEALEHVFSVDQCRVHFRAPDGTLRWVFLILSNGVECVTDYGASDEQFTSIIERVCKYFDL